MRVERFSAPSLIAPEAPLVGVEVEIDHPMAPQYEVHVFRVGAETEFYKFMRKLHPDNFKNAGGKMRITNIYLHEPQANQVELGSDIQEVC